MAELLLTDTPVSGGGGCPPLSVSTLERALEQAEDEEGKDGLGGMEGQAARQVLVCPRPRSRGPPPHLAHTRALTAARDKATAQVAGWRVPAGASCGEWGTERAQLQEQTLPHPVWFLHGGRGKAEKRNPGLGEEKGKKQSGTWLWPPAEAATQPLGQELRTSETQGQIPATASAEPRNDRHGSLVLTLTLERGHRSQGHPRHARLCMATGFAGANAEPIPPGSAGNSRWKRRGIVTASSAPRSRRLYTRAPVSLTTTFQHRDQVLTRDQGICD